MSQQFSCRICLLSMFHRCQSGTLYTNIQKSEIPQRVFFQKDLYSHQNRANLSNKQSCKSSVYGIGLHTCHLTHGKNFRHSCPQQIRLIHIRLPVTHGGSWFVYLLWGMARRTAAKSKTTPRSRSSNALAVVALQGIHLHQLRPNVWLEGILWTHCLIRGTMTQKWGHKYGKSFHSCSGLMKRVKGS